MAMELTDGHLWSRKEKLERLAEADRYDEDIRYMLGKTCADLGMHVEAVEHYTDCLGLDPNYIGAYLAKAESYLALGFHEVAMKVAVQGYEIAKQLSHKAVTDEFDRLIEKIKASDGDD